MTRRRARAVTTALATAFTGLTAIPASAAPPTWKSTPLPPLSGLR